MSVPDCEECSNIVDLRYEIGNGSASRLSAILTMWCH